MINMFRRYNVRRDGCSFRSGTTISALLEHHLGYQLRRLLVVHDIVLLLLLLVK